jgi:hypothetical protein
MPLARSANSMNSVRLVHDLWQKNSESLDFL